PLRILRRVRVVSLYFLPLGLVRDRIDRLFPQVLRRHKVVQTRRKFALVRGRLIYCSAHLPKIFMQDRLARMLNCFLISRDRYRKKDDHNEHCDHQFEERKSPLTEAGRRTTEREIRSPFFPFSFSSLLAITSHYTCLHSGPHPSKTNAHQKRLPSPIRYPIPHMRIEVSSPSPRSS